MTHYAELSEKEVDMVHKPPHYQFFGLQALRIIRDSMTEDEFRGYCMGNALKYRLRAGKKGDIEEDIAKALVYEEIYEVYK